MSDVKRARESTDAAVLGRLLRTSKSKRVRRALAQNPNASWEILRELVAEYPYDVLDNPSFPLLLLSDPGLFHNLSIGALSGLASARDRLGQILGWTDEPPWTELQATLVCMAHARRRLPFGDGYKPGLAFLRRAMVERQLLPDEIELHLVADPSEQVRKALATTSKASTVIESLLDDDVNHPNLASNQHLPTCYQWALASTGDVRIRLRLARNPGISASVLEKLAEDPETSVRGAVALATATPEATWQRLSWDLDRSVQAAARRAKRPQPNPRTAR